MPKRRPQAARQRPKRTPHPASSFIDERGTFTRTRTHQPPTLDGLRIAAFSDVGEQDPAAIVAWFRAVHPRPDFALYAGDGISRLCPKRGPNYLEQIARATRFGLGAIIGNDEPESTRDLIRGERVYELSQRAVILGRYVFVGLDGAPAQRGMRNPYELEEPEYVAGYFFELHGRTRTRALSRYVSRLWAQGSWPKELPRDAVFILCSHAPPWGMLDRATSGMHLGWHSLAELLMRHPRDPEKLAEYWPDVIVCGHVHAQGGQMDGDNGVTVVNVASHERATDPVRIALLNIVGRPGMQWSPRWGFRWDAPVCDWRLIRPAVPPWARESMSEHAWEVHNHAVLYGVQESRAKVLRDAGLLGIAEVAAAEYETLRPLAKRLYMPDDELRRLPQRARAVMEGRPMPLGKFERPSRDCYYIDIETDLGQHWIWLIACLHGRTGEFRQFLALGPSREGAMLREFRQFVESQSGADWVAYSNCNLEQRLISARLVHYGMPPLASPIRDIYSSLHSAIAFPGLGEGLKGAARAVGYRLRHPHLDGISAGLGAPRDGDEAVPQELLEYNEDDVRSLAFLVEAAHQICDGGDGSAVQ